MRWQQCRSLLLIVDCLVMVLPQFWKEQMQEVRPAFFSPSTLSTVLLWSIEVADDDITASEGTAIETAERKEIRSGIIILLLLSLYHCWPKIIPSAEEYRS